jgi:hypothetical protein
MKAISSILSLALLFSPCDVFGMENEVQQLRGSPALAVSTQILGLIAALIDSSLLLLCDLDLT